MNLSLDSPSVPNCIKYYSFTVSLESRYYESSKFAFFFQNCFGYSSFKFLHRFQTTLCNFFKNNTASTFIGIALICYGENCHPNNIGTFNLHIAHISLCLDLPKCPSAKIYSLWYMVLYNYKALQVFYFFSWVHMKISIF